MVASGSWKSKVNKHSQIIALTTQITELKKEFKETKAVKNANTPAAITPAPTSSGSGSNKSKMWRLDKVDNKEEFNTVLKDGKTYYWCDKHKYPSSNSNVQGINVFHKPTDHDAWLECKTALNGRGGKGGKEKLQLPLLLQLPSHLRHWVQQYYPLQSPFRKLNDNCWSYWRSIHQNLGEVLQCLGKLNGPKCRIELIMDMIFFQLNSQFGLPFLSYYYFKLFYQDIIYYNLRHS